MQQFKIYSWAHLTQLIGHVDAALVRQAVDELRRDIPAAQRNVWVLDVRGATSYDDRSMMQLRPLLEPLASLGVTRLVFLATPASALGGTIIQASTSLPVTTFTDYASLKGWLDRGCR